MEPLAPIRPRPSGNPKTIAMLCHVLGFAGYLVPFGNIIGPLVLWLIKRTESPMIDEHGKEALNFQISITIYTLACFPLMFVLIGFPLMLAVMVLDVVCIVLAAIKANNGEPYRYPLTIRLVK
jgi:uncharacterized protein